MEDSISAVDLFCGAGGMTRGLLDAGIRVNAGIDIDGTCRYPYETNNGVKFIEDNITTISGDTISNLYPKDHIKVLVGCAPCQPFSSQAHTKKDREKDEKWGILYSFGSLIEEILPEIVSMENVNYLQSKDVFRDFVDTLEESDYHVFWKSIYCPYYGVPQTRRRLVLLASRLGKIELIPYTHNKDNAPTVRDYIGDLELIKDGKTSLNDPLHRACEFSEMNKRRIRQSKPGGTWKDWDEELLLPCHKKDTGKSYASVYGRMEWDSQAPTITTQFYRYGTGRFGHPEQDRALSLREGALLQRFKSDYDLIDPELNFSIRRIGMHIGNAVPVVIGEVVGLSIIDHLRCVLT